MSSEMPCSHSSVKPRGIIRYTGQRIRPPALLDISPDARARVKNGTPYQSTAKHMGVRKTM